MFAKVHILRLLKCQDGATAIEYGLIVSLLVLAIIGGMSAFATQANEMLNNVATAVENARHD